MVEVFIPVPGQRETAPLRHTSRRRSIRGQRVAVVNNGWGSMDRLASHIERELRDAYGVDEVLHCRNHDKGNPASPEFLDDIAAKVAGAITGLGN